MATTLGGKDKLHTAVEGDLAFWTMDVDLEVNFGSIHGITTIKLGTVV